jgi:hypothetical protein
MTGQPPEAPDHIPLSPEELGQLHLHAADAMKRQSEGMANLAFCAVFTRGDVVLVHQDSRRSHKDQRGKGAKSFTARAIIQSTSKSNRSHYKIIWTTDGLVAREKAGQISVRMWPAWKLKLCQTTKSTGTFYTPGEDDALQKEETRIRTEVLAQGEETSAEDESEEEPDEPPIDDREEIATIAERCEL